MLGKGFGGAESFGGAPGKPVALPSWASEALSTVEVPDLGALPDVSVLPNGLRLIVQRNMWGAPFPCSARCGR